VGGVEGGSKNGLLVCSHVKLYDLTFNVRKE
jgi:hypothetical protein